ncbi:MAG: type IV pilus twitching motility protein PilT [Armatimonadetes bacterium]|nr:type IV pilus twitching motility protein PilT [Armatimonadota bacterium]
MELLDLLNLAVHKGASDLHLLVGVPPVLRVDGEIIVEDYDVLTPEMTRELILGCLTPDQKDTLERELQLCFSMKVPDLGYFRTAVYYEQGTLGAAIRIGMSDIKSLEELGLPPVAAELTRKSSGLILITGPTGSGKTTTLNSMIDIINRERRCKIIMVEDPIEHIHSNKRSIVVQQEVHTDTKSFGRALIHILRQDPNVIGVGEMRDLETISMALTAAETGHLVISTLHTPDAPQTVDRVVDVFPPNQQNQIRTQLANSLEAVISQQLLPRVDGPGRVLATELMICTPAVQNIIRENKVQMLRNVISTSQSAGMYTMDSSLRNLYQRGIITYDTAVTKARVPDELRLRGPGTPVAIANGLERL